MGVLLRVMFSHIPDEAKSGGLAKTCVPGKNYSVPEKIESLNGYKFSFSCIELKIVCGHPGSDFLNTVFQIAKTFLFVTIQSKFKCHVYLAIVSVEMEDDVVFLTYITNWR